jgi:hypothetical protein
MSDPDPSTEELVDNQSYKLPEVDSFEGCNNNFSSLSEFVSAAFLEMREAREHNQAQLIRITEEANNNITAISTDMKAILNSHSTMFTLSIVAIAVTAVLIKGAIDALSKIFG